MSVLSEQANDAASTDTLKPSALVEALVNLLKAEFSDHVDTELAEEIGGIITELYSVADISTLSEAETSLLCDALIESTAVEYSTDAAALLEQIISENPQMATNQRIARLAVPGVAFEDGNFSSTRAGDMLATLVRHSPELGIAELIASTEPIPVHPHFRSDNDGLA